MPHALTELKLAEVTRPASEPAHEIRADVCVVGAGIAGLSAAVESARLHRDVVLVDSLPLIGGQMVHSLIGLFCGVFGNGPEYRQLTHGIFDDIFRDLGLPATCISSPATPRPSTTTRWPSAAGSSGRSGASASRRSSAPCCSAPTCETGGSPGSSSRPATGNGRSRRTASSTPAATPP